MFPHFLVSIFLFLTTAQENLSPLLSQPPSDLKLERISDVVEGHEDLYLASEFPYRTDHGVQWVAVFSSTGSTKLENAYFEWGNVWTAFEQHDAMAYVASFEGQSMGMVEVKVSLANGEQITLKSWLPTKTGCWTNTPRYEAFQEVDEFGEVWPYMKLQWDPTADVIMYGIANKEWCGNIMLYGGTNPCDSFRGLTTEPTPPKYCGEIPSKYQSNNLTIVQDGDGIIQYYTEGRSRRFTPTPEQPGKKIATNDLTTVAPNRNAIVQWNDAVH
eukprot:Gregarina_sp_Pseudo_9__1721@NODE_2167_length_1116_cov_404_705664_g1995_i0_p1_GENE_NODE_2167_length_1116_cov_404_705664_g1995_i0NODE_2167_length_1116_cov_404_705664_g1995_i0_p1_ORF_typecomplete_len272_score17_18PAW/PF04721_17/0_005PilP/PF04351_13/0_065_NODE_2167_length_1116_cov_404_705664_g1995_i0175990